jgi:hypothetical protein
MKNEDVYKYYGWNPSDGNHKALDSEELINSHSFSFYALRFYNKVIKIITLKFF